VHLILPVLFTVGVLAFLAFVALRQYREHIGNAPRRAEIEAGACFETTLDQVRVLGTNGRWMTDMKNLPKRLVVSTDAFTVCALYDEYVFEGPESSIAFSQAPSRSTHRDWIVITRQKGDRQVQLAISKKGSMQEIWHALAGTGATLRPPSIRARKSNQL
jgi:hypothetical protein